MPDTLPHKSHTDHTPVWLFSFTQKISTKVADYQHLNSFLDNF